MQTIVRSLAVLAVLSLAACGFHLRGEVKLAPSLQRVIVISSDPGSPLKRSVEDAMKRAGATVAAVPGEALRKSA